MTITAGPSDVADFEAHRRALTGLAYRMLGSRAEAEDVVQDAYLRWHAGDRAAIDEPRRYLGTVVMRLCLDRMKSARARREFYVGQWLPEPVVDEAFYDETAGDLAHGNARPRAALATRACEFSVARCVRPRFCRSEPRARPQPSGLPSACGARPGAYCRRPAPFPGPVRRRPSPGGRVSTSRGLRRRPRLGGRFLRGTWCSIPTAAVNASRHSTQSSAARKLWRFLDGVSRKNAGFATVEVRDATVNGLPGFVVRGEDGAIDTMAFECRDGCITAIYITRNPDKLRHVRF